MTKKQLLRNNFEFGRRGVMGSKHSFVPMPGIGVKMMGAGIFTLGEQPTGTGISLLGTGGGLRQKLKKLIKPLLKTGKKIALDIAKKKAESIKQDELRGIAKKALAKLETGDVEKALTEQNKLESITKLAKKGLKGIEPELLRLQKKGTKKAIARISGDQRPEKKVKGDGHGKGQPMMDAVAKHSDRKLKRGAQGYTEDDRQLTLLKDVIRSKKITTKTNRSGGRMVGNGVQFA